MADLKNNLGAMIRARRKEMKFSQADLAEKVDLSAKYLGEVERGEGNVSIEKLGNIADALDIRLGRLLDNAYSKDRDYLITDINEMLDKADDAEVRLVHRLVSDVL